MKKAAAHFAFLFCAFTLQSQIDRSTVPQAGPPPEIQLKSPESYDLMSGLKVMVVEDHKLPRVSAYLILDNAPVLEGDKAGMSALTGMLLGNGSANISKEDYYEEVDFLGARIQFSAQRATARSLTKYFPRVLELLADAAINPNFKEADFETEKARLLTSLKNQEKDIGAVADRLVSALAYGVDHPYGEFMTEASLNNVSLDDVQQFYRDYFVPANAYLIIIGDTDMEQVQDLVSRYFTSWTRAIPPTYSFTRPTDALFTQINLVDMPNAVQSEIRAVNLVDLKMNDPDYLPAILANRILGGNFQGRLNLNIREDKGYAYYAYSSLGDDKYAPAAFTVYTSVRNAVTDSAVVQILHELDSITLPTITPEDLSNVKAEYTGSFVMALEKPETIAQYALNIKTENLPEDFYTTYLERLNDVSLEQVQQAAGKYIKPGNTRIVISGNGREIIPALEAINFNGREVPIRYYDKQAKAVENPLQNAAIPSGVTIQTVLNDYFDAIGGKDAIEGINTLKLVYEGEVMGSAIKMVEHRTPNKFAQTTFMNDTPAMAVVANGGEVYMKQSGSKIPIPPAMQKDLEKMLGILPEQLIMENPDATLSGIEKVEDKDAYRIDVPGEMIQASFYYDVNSGLKLKEATVISMNGQSQSQEVLYKDYRNFEGVLFPELRSGTLGGQPLESRLTEVKINEGVSDADFQ